MKATREEMKNKAIASLRASFEFEGIVFTDEEIRQMVREVREKRKRKALPLSL